MIVGSINEDRKIESRVAITPDNVKKFIGLGLKVLIEKECTHLEAAQEETQSGCQRARGSCSREKGGRCTIR